MPKSYSVHPNYIEQVKLIWERKSEGCEQDLAQELGLAQPLVHFFLKGRPVDGLCFLEICQLLELDWQEVAGLNLPELSAEVSEVNQALNSLVNTLCEMLRRLTRKAGNALNADRTSIFLLDRHTKTLGSINAEDGEGGSLVIDIPSDQGIASLAASSLQVINIPFDLYDDSRSTEAKKMDKITKYRTYTLLAWPIFDQQTNLISVVQFLNKLKEDYDPRDELSLRIDKNGFSKDDEALFASFVPAILRVLNRCESCYQLALKLKENPVLQQQGVVLKNAELVEELMRREKQLRRSLDKIDLSPQWRVRSPR